MVQGQFNICFTYVYDALMEFEVQRLLSKWKVKYKNLPYLPISNLRAFPLILVSRHALVFLTFIIIYLHISSSTHKLESGSLKKWETPLITKQVN
jgi:hypothetical protein